jgi:hypothetical protein
MEPSADFVQRLLIRGAQTHADLLPQSRWVNGTCPPYPQRLRRGILILLVACLRRIWRNRPRCLCAPGRADNSRPPGKPGRCSAGSPRGANKRTLGG